MIGIFRGHPVVLRHQTEGYKWLHSLYDPSDMYIISEEKLRDERTVSSDNLKYIGNMVPIQSIALDKNNLWQFLSRDIKKFDLIIDQGEHYPLSMLVNKYAKKHGVLTIDVHQANDFYDRFFNVPLYWKIISYLDLPLRLRFRGFRHLMYVLLKYDPKLFAFIVKHFNIAGFRFYPSLPSEYRFDKCFVQGNKYKQIYKLMGYTDNDVVIVGDRDLHKYNNWKGDSYQSDKPYIIYVDSNDAVNYAFQNELNELAKYIINQGYDFLFYPHPNLSDEFLALLNKNIKVLQKRTIEKYINNADFVFTHNSNMVQLLVYARKRFCLLYDKKMVGGSFFKLQEEKAHELGVPNVDIVKRDDILAIVKNYNFDEKKYAHYLYEYCGNDDIIKKGKDAILLEHVSKMLENRNK